MRFLIGLTVTIASLVASCGGDSSYKDPEPTKPAPSGDPDFDKVQPLIAANCGVCHSIGNAKGLPSFDTSAKFKASKAKARLTAGTMPPAPKTISNVDKAALLAYLGG